MHFHVFWNAEFKCIRKLWCGHWTFRSWVQLEYVDDSLKHFKLNTMIKNFVLIKTVLLFLITLIKNKLYLSLEVYIKEHWHLTKFLEESTSHILNCFSFLLVRCYFSYTLAGLRSVFPNEPRIKRNWGWAPHCFRRHTPVRTISVRVSI